ncbi:MAG: thioredoxin family protein, partial [Phormidesmis sp.]
TEPGYYFKGFVPQTVIFNQAGEVIFNEAGQVDYETIDDKLRDVFDLLPREESLDLRRRSINEVNSELVPE